MAKMNARKPTVYEVVETFQMSALEAYRAAAGIRGLTVGRYTTAVERGILEDAADRAVRAAELLAGAGRELMRLDARDDYPAGPDLTDLDDAESSNSDTVIMDPSDMDNFIDDRD